MGRLVDALPKLQQRFRRARMDDFLATLKVTERMTVLDVGGTPDIWAALPLSPKVVILNTLRATPEAYSREFTNVTGDGCNLPFADGSFDIVFSNSVIEHVGSADAQRSFAAEVSRVGKSYWIQTPNRNFPMETHLLTPLVHFLPKRWKASVVRRFTVWEWLHRPDTEAKRWYLDHFLHQIRLLSGRDLGALFPAANIRRERFLFLTKSLIAWRRA